MILPFPHRNVSRSRWTRLVPVLAAAWCLTGCAGMGMTEATSPFSALVAFYRGPLNHLAAVRAGVCPMTPSCSEYAMEAVAKHGEVVGWIMACDRLMRCGRDECRLVAPIQTPEGHRTPDPVSANDFGWAGKDGEAPSLHETHGHD